MSFSAYCLKLKLYLHDTTRIDLIALGLLPFATCWVYNNSFSCEVHTLVPISYAEKHATLLEATFHQVVSVLFIT